MDAIYRRPSIDWASEISRACQARAPSACGTQSVMESLVPTNGFLIPQDPQVPTDGNVLFAGSIHADVLTALEKNTFK